MAPRHERELGRGEQSVAHDELVGRPGPGRRRRPVGVDAGTAGGDQHDVALAGGDERRGIEQGGNAQGAGPPGAGPEAQFEDDLRAVGPHHSVDLVGRDPGIGQCPERPEQGDGRRIVVRQGPGLHRVGDAGDGDVTEGMWRRHGRPSWSVASLGTPAYSRARTGGVMRAGRSCVDDARRASAAQRYGRLTSGPRRLRGLGRSCSACERTAARSGGRHRLRRSWRRAAPAAGRLAGAGRAAPVAGAGAGPAARDRAGTSPGRPARRCRATCAARCRSRWTTAIPPGARCRWR